MHKLLLIHKLLVYKYLSIIKIVIYSEYTSQLNFNIQFEFFILKYYLIPSIEIMKIL